MILYLPSKNVNGLLVNCMPNSGIIYKDSKEYKKFCNQEKTILRTQMRMNFEIINIIIILILRNIFFEDCLSSSKVEDRWLG